MSFVIQANVVHSQSITWEKRYINPQAPFRNAINTICESDSGNFFLVGYSLLPSPINNYKIWVIKINSNGDTLWMKNIGRNGSAGISTISTNDGGCLLAGSANEAFTIKLDRDGNILWEKYYGISGVESRKITKAKDGGYIICGFQNIRDGFIYKLDSNGNYMWANTYNSQFLRRYFDVITDYGNGFLISGYEVKTQGDTAKAIVLKINDSGETIWEKKLLFNDPTAAFSIQKLKNNYIIAGSLGISALKTGRVFFMKIDDSGNYTKPVILKTNDNVYYGDFDILESNKLVFTMSIDSVNGIMSGKSLIADTLGNILHKKIFPTSDFIEFKSIQSIDNGDLIFAGIAGFYIPGSEQIGYVVRTDSLLNLKTTSIQNYNLLFADKFELYQNFPNPFNSSTKIKYKINEVTNVIIKLIDINGKIIIIQKSKKQNPGFYEIDLNYEYYNLSTGIYFIELEIEKGFKKVIKTLFLK